MQLALTAIVPAPAPSPQAAPRVAAPAPGQAAFAKVLAARQRDAKAADTRQAHAAEASAQHSRRHEAARDSGSASRSTVETAEAVEPAEPVQPLPGDETNGAAAPPSSDTAAAKPAAPTLAELLAALNRTPADDAGQAAEDAGIGSAASAARGTRAIAALPPGGRHTTGTPPHADVTQALAEDARAAPETHDAAAEAMSAGTDLNLARSEARGESAQAASATMTAPSAALHSAPRTELAAAPQAVTLTTPATAPEFREALGVQVSVLARGGVQHAELHLNPDDMGPISVQIALDGTQAQVQFGADSLATRQLIEAGLPELAAALRDAGLTLSGGGVSQHSRGQADGGAPEHRAPDGSSAAHGDAPHATAAPPRTQLRLPQGAVDLYA